MGDTIFLRANYTHPGATPQMVEFKSIDLEMNPRKNIAAILVLEAV